MVIVINSLVSSQFSVKALSGTDKDHQTSSRSLLGFLEDLMSAISLRVSAEVLKMTQFEKKTHTSTTLILMEADENMRLLMKSFKDNSSSNSHIRGLGSGIFVSPLAQDY